MLVSQTPTIVAKDGKVVLDHRQPRQPDDHQHRPVQIVVNVLDFDMDIRAAVDAPRLHHQWFPDTAQFRGRRRLSEVVESLEAMGHDVRRHRAGRRAFDRARSQDGEVRRGRGSSDQRQSVGILIC